ncbi:serine/threonine-protein kinase 17A-like isoform X1 [Alosa alosa]|uniref:serine/threonine-protein kinase 17A-like isoform X1 n=1 Tax=Alosa alosa TaxID=278164 RepID=UPI00201515D5|nr:serine/threonine-protein kinase 17A-like isoform X1 [Alosa alosa]
MDVILQIPQVNKARRYTCQERPALLTDIKINIRNETLTERYSLTPGKELGRGKFGVVRRCVEKHTGIEYAAKFVRKRRKGQDCRGEVIHEVAALELTRACPRVINLHEVYETASEMVLLLECAAGGEIFEQCVAFSELDAKLLLRQILEGVAFLHSNNIVHLDLKPQNLLLTSTKPLGDIKIVDFGLSRVVRQNQELREIMGTPEYVAPEVLNYEPISTATDMWSIGVLTYIMLTGLSPFLGEDKQETFLNISQVDVSYAGEELEALHPAAILFIQALLLKDARVHACVCVCVYRSRLSAEECLRHEWLRGPERQKQARTEACVSGHEQLLSPEKDPAVEDLIVMAAYTLGQCRQSDSEAFSQEPDPTATCFRLGEPFHSMQKAIY